ncbi:MAG: hypothetical protein K9G48_13815 [Reyranella sp.]|nr:hypothetical protein [Reyranella sp.]
MVVLPVRTLSTLIDASHDGVRAETKRLCLVNAARIDDAIRSASQAMNDIGGPFRLPDDTTVLVGDPIYGEGRRTTWGEFRRDNADGFSDEELDEIGSAIRHDVTYMGGGGAEGNWWIRRAA